MAYKVRVHVSTKDATKKQKYPVKRYRYFGTGKTGTGDAYETKKAAEDRAKKLTMVYPGREVKVIKASDSLTYFG